VVFFCARSVTQMIPRWQSGTRLKPHVGLRGQDLIWLALSNACHAYWGSSRWAQTVANCYTWDRMRTRTRRCCQRIDRWKRHTKASGVRNKYRTTVTVSSTGIVRRGAETRAFVRTVDCNTTLHHEDDRRIKTTKCQKETKPEAQRFGGHGGFRSKKGRVLGAILNSLRS
jgi:hypothetical protein